MGSQYPILPTTVNSLFALIKANVTSLGDTNSPLMVAIAQAIPTEVLTEALEGALTQIDPDKNAFWLEPPPPGFHVIVMKSPSGDVYTGVGLTPNEARIQLLLNYLVPR